MQLNIVALESAFGMGSGYVLNFSDRTCREFIWDAVGSDINDGAYSKYGTSKAKHLRAFWEAERDNVVAALRKPPFDRLARAVRESIDAGCSEEGLDRLHTFSVEYAPILAGKRDIATPRYKPLDSVVPALWSTLANQSESAHERIL